MAKRNQGKNRHHVPQEYLFGNLRLLRKAIITYVHEKNVASLLVDHLDRAVS